MSALDVHDTATCPVAEVCAGCGRLGVGLVAATAWADLGVFCLTVCAVCVEVGSVPAVGPSGDDAVLDHCVHLGTDMDAMAEALAGEGR